jgi:hypothetical protein
MKTAVASLFIGTLIILSLLKVIDFDSKYLFILAIMIIIFTYDDTQTETFVTSNEAVQTIASAYNASKMTVTDITATGSMSTPNGFRIGTDDKAGMYKGTGDGADFDNYNVAIKSWWGVGFPSSCCDGAGNGAEKNKNRIVFNTRTGDAHFKGNLVVDGSITVGGDSTIKNDIILDGNKNKWIIHHPQDDRKSLFIAPWNGAPNWNWAANMNINNNGTIYSNSSDIGDWMFRPAGDLLNIARSGKFRAIKFKNSGDRATIGTGDWNGGSWETYLESRPPCRGDRGPADGYAWAWKSCGSDWSV